MKMPTLGILLISVNSKNTKNVLSYTRSVLARTKIKNALLFDLNAVPLSCAERKSFNCRQARNLDGSCPRSCKIPSLMDQGPPFSTIKTIAFVELCAQLRSTKWSPGSSWQTGSSQDFGGMSMRAQQLRVGSTICGRSLRSGDGDFSEKRQR